MKMICTPLTRKAMTLLDADNCPPYLLDSIYLTDTEYQQLLESGALESINSSLDKIIDDYEDESITTTKELKKSLTILEKHLAPNNLETMMKIIHLNSLAIEKKTGLFFFF